MLSMADRIQEWKWNRKQRRKRKETSTVWMEKRNENVVRFDLSHSGSKIQRQCLLYQISRWAQACAPATAKCVFSLLCQGVQKWHQNDLSFTFDSFSRRQIKIHKLVQMDEVIGRYCLAATRGIFSNLWLEFMHLDCSSLTGIKGGEIVCRCVHSPAAL